MGKKRDLMENNALSFFFWGRIFFINIFEREKQELAPFSSYKTHTTHNSLFRSDKELQLETSALGTLYGGQFTLSTQLIKPNNLEISSV